MQPECIKDITAREILDSRGNPTVQATVYSASGIAGTALVPSGASTGKYEACELRDTENPRYHYKGVQQAVANIHEPIAPALQGVQVYQQQEIDQRLCTLDGSSNKSTLGANALLAVSMAAACSAANSKKVALYQWLAYLMEEEELPFESWQQESDVCHQKIVPVPMMNVINGGVHADNNIDFQEFMLLPVGADSMREAVRYAAEIFHVLKRHLQQQGLNTAVGDEGGFAPDLRANEQAIEVLLQAIEQAGFTAGKDIYLALDVASTEFYRAGKYHLMSEERQLDATQFVEYLLSWVQQYPILSIEDGMAEDDWEGWQLLTAELGGRVQLVGDDLFVTNTARLQRGIEQQAANAILIKLNQIGTLTETLAAVRLAKKSAYAAIISHRSGETEDSFIADLAVATGCGQIKTGSLCRSERVAKYNRLMQIEDELGSSALYPGRNAFPHLDTAEKE